MSGSSMSAVPATLASRFVSKGCGVPIGFGVFPRVSSGGCMAHRRTRAICPHGDAARPYPVWPEPGWPLGQPSELDEALAELESALTDCDLALGNSIDALTNQDVSDALRSLPLERRQAVLRPLGLMLTPRQISQSLCQDVRSRMSRADGHQARHAATALTRNVSIDVGRSAFTEKMTTSPA